jgi:glutamyl-Q tRNA(Asp) synthetase
MMAGVAHHSGGTGGTGDIGGMGGIGGMGNTGDPPQPPATPYIGRFAPSPSGPLHAGSLVAALASYLDAKIHHGQWLVRIEDVDETRSVPGADQQILSTLQQLGLQWDGEVLWQSQRKALYQAAYQQLGQYVYGCACSRREIADSRLGLAPDGAAIYPGTCRSGVAPGRLARTLRLRVPDPAQAEISFIDRRLGPIRQNLAQEVGDFVLQRADGFWSYQLAVVVDDAAQGVTDVVRGADLLDSTARQIYLHRLLYGTVPALPRYLHLPLLRHPNGEKLSKQTGAAALDVHQPLATLKAAAAALTLELGLASDLAQFWRMALAEWQSRWLIRPSPDSASSVSSAHQAESANQANLTTLGN